VGEVVSLLTQMGGSFVSILTKGGLIMVPLLASPILSLAGIIERLCIWRRIGKSARGATILSLVAAGHQTQAMKVARVSQHSVAPILLVGLEYQYPASSMAMGLTAQAELHRRALAYQTRLVRPLDDSLRYEKDTLRDWFRNESSIIKTFLKGTK
jgi:hypothetical protein